MRTRTHHLAAAVLTATTLSVAACGGHDKTSNAAGGDVSSTPSAVAPSASVAPVDSTPARHHSKIAGAALGAAAGHMLGGHAVAGAAAGALIQHERNKHPQ